MKLSKQEESKLLTHGVLVTLIFLMLLIGSYMGMNYLVQETNKEAATTVEANKNLLITNRKEARETRFLKENGPAIEAMWTTLKSWGSGVTTGNVSALTSAGLVDSLPLPPSRLPGNPTEYAGLRLSGNKTEYQRFLDALSNVEAAQGLVQVRSTTISLPPSIPPNAPKPTFLNIQLELVAPLAR